MPCRIIPLSGLRMHEKVARDRLDAMVRWLEKYGVTTPIVVEKKHRVILDGHHRYAALRKLGYRKTPAYLVDYKDVEVLPRRKIKVSRELVIKRALSGRPFPPKTTRHVYSKRLKMIKVPLDRLR